MKATELRINKEALKIANRAIKLAEAQGMDEKRLNAMKQALLFIKISVDENIKEAIKQLHERSLPTVEEVDKQTKNQ